MRAAVRIRDGLWWVASNTDLTIPTAFGVAPGHGVLVETLRRFSGVEPVVAGQAVAAAARRDGPPGRRRPAADGRRPAGHRHRGCGQRRDRLAAGPDRRDRAGRAGGGAGRRSGRRTSPPTSAGCSHGASGGRRCARAARRRCGGWTAASTDGRLGRHRRGRGRGLVAGGRRRPAGPTRDASGQHVATDGRAAAAIASGHV